MSDRTFRGGVGDYPSRMTAEPDSANPEGWACVAYGKELPEAMGVRRICFFPNSPCISASECTDRMSDERQRVYRRMQELSAVDPFWADIADEFPVPDRLLGGPGHDTGSGAGSAS